MTDRDPKSFHEAWMAEQFAEEFEEERKRKLAQAEALAEAAQEVRDAGQSEEEEPDEPEDASVVKTYVWGTSDCQIVVSARTREEARAYVREQMTGFLPPGVDDEKPEILEEGDVRWCWS